MTAPHAQAGEVAAVLAPIERDEHMGRDYIPLPGGWEVQTKGSGSTYRICEPDGRRLAVPPSPYLHDTLTQMARAVHAAVEQMAAENERLRADAARLDWLVANVKEQLTAGSLKGEQPIEHKTQYVLPVLIAWADFCGQIGFREAIDIARGAIHDDP